MASMDLKEKKVTVVGLGNSGVNAAILLSGAGASVWVTDCRDTPEIRDAIKDFAARDIKVELGRHTKGFIVGSDLVVVSPGIEDSSPPLGWAAELHIPVIGEMELGYRFCDGKIIAITGTNGKSTVTALIGEILKRKGCDAVVCGNIGNSLCGEILRIKEKTWVVLEVSSFQLERIEHFKPRIAVILNVTDDHLDRYKDFDEYFRTKLKIFANQSRDDVLILNHDAVTLKGIDDIAPSRVFRYSKSSNLAAFGEDCVYVKDAEVMRFANGREERIFPVRDIPLKGLHNLENVLAAALTCSIAEIDYSSIGSAVAGFMGLPHRVETVDIINGVEYIDDSKGTTVDSTYRALESSSAPVILIAGGRDKNSNYSLMRELVRDKVRCIILIGEAKDKIKKALGDVVETREAKTMYEAVELARGLAVRGCAVLLSPMCSSFDMFRDYKQRGEAFRDAVKRVRTVPARAA